MRRTQRSEDERGSYQAAEERLEVALQNKLGTICMSSICCVALIQLLSCFREP